MTDQLITKYRPATWKQVIGHEDVVEALQRAISSPSHPHSFLFTASGGMGKTTMARIIAADVGADTLEIDAASNSGVDAMREIVELGGHVPLSGNQKRMIIIDECHTLSKNAWQALLKIMEEPPSYLYFALCTTEAHKVPDTIKQRCYQVQLKSVKAKDIGDLIDFIASEEKMDLKDDIWTLIIQECDGSPRKAIGLLQSLNGCKTVEEASRILKLQSDEDEPTKVLAGMLLSGDAPWSKIQAILKQLNEDGEDWEQAMIGVARYMVAVMVKTNKPDIAERAAEVLDALSTPVNSYDPKAVFFAAVGRVFWRKY